MNPAETRARRRDWTVLEVLGWTSQRFTEKGLATPRLDAELLIAHGLQGRRIDVYTRSTELLGPEPLERIRVAVKRRLAGESVAYITGHKEFWGLTFQVDPRVLVPRPDTETLIQVALDRLPVDGVNLRVVDIGTGSGAIAVTLAHERPQVEVLATDISADALAVARANAERMQARVRFFEGRDLAPVAAEAPFTLIVSNPPYVPAGDIPHLAPEVRCEPHLALDGGPDGLDVIRRLVPAAWPLISPGGHLVLELGQGQAPAIKQLMETQGFIDVQAHADLAGIERVVSGRKPEAS